MSVEQIKLYPFNNVVAAGVANVDLANLIGFTIEGIYLQLGGGALTKAMLTSIQLKANGKVILDTTGTAADTRMAYRGLTQNAAFLCLDFTEVRGRTRKNLLSGAFDTTLGIKSLRLEITIAGATTPTLVGFAAVSPPMVQDEYKDIRALIARVHRTQQTIGAAGQFPLAIPHMAPEQGGSLFKRMVIYSANMTALQVQRNGIVEHDSIAALNNYRQQYESLKVPQANTYIFDPMIDNFQEGRLFDTIPGHGTQTVQVLGTFSAGETITIESEVLEPFDVY